MWDLFCIVIAAAMTTLAARGAKRSYEKVMPATMDEVMKRRK